MAQSRRGFLCASMGSVTALKAGCMARHHAHHHFPAIQFDEEVENRSDRFSELKGFCDGVPDVDENEFEERRERTRRSLRQEGMDLLVVEAGHHLQFLTGLRWGLSERPLLYLLSMRGPDLWVAPAFEENTLQQRIHNGNVHVWQEHENVYATLLQALRKHGFEEARIALDPNLRFFVTQGIRQQVPHTSSGSTIMDAVRITKSQRELARIRRANEATKAAIRSAAEFIKEGMTEQELGQLVRQAQTVAGLENIWTLPLIGTNAAFPHGTDQKNQLKEGDGILVDTGGSLFGYCSDITRTWVYGQPTEEFQRAWDTVLLAQKAAQNMIRPGIRCGEVDTEARRVLANAKFGGNYESFTHRLGHGIGIQVHEAPYLVRNNDRILRRGMVMSVEPGIYFPNKFGIRIEDIVVVTADSHEIFGPPVHSLEQPFG